MIEAVVHTADIQDRDGGPLVLKHIRGRFPFLCHVFADGGYAGQKFAGALVKTGNWSIEIIKRSDRQGLCLAATSLGCGTTTCLVQP